MSSPNHRRVATLAVAAAVAPAALAATARGHVDYVTEGGKPVEVLRFVLRETTPVDERSHAPTGGLRGFLTEDDD